MERKSKQTRSRKQETRGWKFPFLASSFLLLASSWIVFAASNGNHDYPDNSSEGLEMIAERMKALSASLASIPSPPEFNQTIQIPADVSEKEKNPDPKGRHKMEEERP